MEQDIPERFPYQVAEIIFKEPAEEPKKFSFYCESETEQKITLLDVFEIYLTIMMEGIFIKYPITAETLKTFDENVILNLQPWFHSLGYNVNVQKIPKKNLSEYKEYYCKIILRCDPGWSPYFEIIHPEITENYHFNAGPDSPLKRQIECRLDNLFAIFVYRDMVYKISFNCL